MPTAATTWYIQLNQQMITIGGKQPFSGSFQFAITMISLT
jgi:hypothetical protein